MIILDTCALVFDALSPEKLSMVAKKAIDHACKKDELYCSDITLWEVAMLIEKKRLDVQVDSKVFLELALQARQIKVLDISIEVAWISASYAGYKHFDPADRIIAATAIHHRAGLVTCDMHLQKLRNLQIIW